MSEALALTPSEEVLVGEVIGKGSSAVNSGNIDVLISAMLKVGNDTFTAIKTIVVNDSKLQKEIAEKISETAQQTIQSNDKMAQKVLDTMKANSDAIRSTIPNVSGQDLVACFEELREYTRKMDDIRRETQTYNDRNVQRQKETVERASKKSNNTKDIALGVAGGALGGAGLTYLVLKLLGKIR